VRCATRRLSLSAGYQLHLGSAGYTVADTDTVSVCVRAAGIAPRDYIFNSFVTAVKDPLALRRYQTRHSHFNLFHCERWFIPWNVVRAFCAPVSLAASPATYVLLLTCVG
jgi:hypothetical protein